MMVASTMQGIPLNSIVAVQPVNHESDLAMQINTTVIKDTIVNIINATPIKSGSKEFLESMIPQNTTQPENVTTTKSSPEDEDRQYFDKVHEVPYEINYNAYYPKKPDRFWSDNYGDCDDKSVAFADYLYKKGVRDIWIVTISSPSKNYGHACLEWQNRIFDPTINPPVYNMSRESYYNFVSEDGFTNWKQSIYDSNYKSNVEIRDGL